MIIEALIQNIFIRFVFSCLSQYRKWIQGGQFHSNTRIDGKVVIVTGCNTGIGRETVLDLAGRGAHIHMVCISNSIEEKIINTEQYRSIVGMSRLQKVRNYATGNHCKDWKP